ncbi:WAT1-related protein At5g07050 isoform X1 [Cryptomeria japonica]|uniref:WAT1-related protein At5g07050 isoform X1 n=1 Tax=Cryptomeria japonica TaxID=3369 RepID=UPI0027DA1E18|nr:WAT1-related protein At5g07050 isoform X1 [Cryptomeria japonica]
MGMEMFEKARPYIAMTSLQFGYAGMAILTKISLNNGMSHYVLVVYRHIVATLVLAPFAFFIERKIRPKITFQIFCQIFALGLLGYATCIHFSHLLLDLYINMMSAHQRQWNFCRPVLDQNFYYLGLKFTSPTFGGAMNNLVPATTFVIALIFRMERVKIREIRSQAKIVGTLVCVSGAMLMTLYRGAILPMPWSSHDHPHSSNAATSHDSNSDMIKGCICLIIATLAWAALFVLQASVLKKYSAQLSLATLICLMGSLQSIAITLAVERRPSAWVIGFDMNLLTAVYSGVVGSGIAYYVQGLCMRIKGPVFATAFVPLTMIISAIMDSIILHQNIYLGSVIGGVVIVIGLYGFLWGKAKDTKLTTFTSSEMLPTSHHEKNTMESIETLGVPVESNITFNMKTQPSTV